MTKTKRTKPCNARRLGLLCVLWIGTHLGISVNTNAQRIFSEDFESLTLGRNVEEGLAGAKVWTKTPPAGWVIDDSRVPGVGNPVQNGITEWAGWSFANKDWWVQTAGGQQREQFAFGQGNVMIADPDEWDDAFHLPGLIDMTITTRPIALNNQAANSLVLAYDSSWRPEAVDDGAPNFPVNAEGAPINNQTAVISMLLNGATNEIQRWTSISDEATYHDHFPNESVVIPLNNPAGNSSVTLKFDLVNSANDWWWAVDNIAVGVPPFVTSLAADGVSFTGRIVEALGKSVDQSKGVVAELDGRAVTPLEITKEGDFLSVKYSQSPEVFQPRTRHSVKLKYTSNDNKALEDTLEFVAPGYTTLASTPRSVTATMRDAAWLTVDESKGISLELDGVAVTTASVTRTDAIVTAIYTRTEPFAPNSPHALKVTFTTAAGKLVGETLEFTAPDIIALPAALATATGTGAQPGMKWRTHQLATARATTVAAAESELAGTLGESIHDPAGQGADGYFLIDYVNFEQAVGEAGNFKSSGNPPANVDDLGIPGIPGTAGGSDNIAGEALTFVEIPQAGLYTMVVNSDDGFQVSVGTTNSATQVVLAKWDLGRSAVDSEFYFRAEQAGVYLFRLLWFEGTGGASVEWFTVNADGTLALVGGSQTGSLKAYRVRIVAEPSTGGNAGGGVSQRIYGEDFEGLTLGRNVEEGLAGAKVWTKTPPAGWVIDDSRVPGVGNPVQNGITEWAGWSFANKDWWVQTAGGQQREQFAFGQGTVMIADPDEWDDAFHLPGLIDMTITTKPIVLSNQAANSLVLAYDSSWRPEAVDDGAPNFPVNEEGSPINNQTAVISMLINGATNEIQRWTSINDEPTYHDHFPNESVVIPLNNPAGNSSVTLKFDLINSANDWWWAVDNIAVGVPPFVTSLAADGVSFTGRIVEALGKSVDQSKGVVAELDGRAVTPLEVAKEGDFLSVKYSQSPEVFQPRTRHSVKLKYTSNENKALEDTLEFVAPGYTTLASTPRSVTATIRDAAWLTIDESKGVGLELDGVAVTTASVTRTDAIVTAIYTRTEPFVPNSQHTMKVTFTTAAGKLVGETLEFTAPDIIALPAALATATGTGAQPGMKWRTHQLATARATTVAAAESELAGTLGESIHDPAGQGVDGYFLIDYVNFEQAVGEAGNFKSSANPPENVDDLGIPGIPGTAGGSDNVVGEALTFVEIPQAGLYTMVVNSDDGFLVSVGTTNSPKQVVLGQWDNSRGAANSEFYFRAEQPGVYNFRLLWFEGTGGASVEWFTVNTDGSRALVGGSQPGALKAYRVRTVAEPTGVAGGNITSIRRSGGMVMLTYTGTLRSSATVNGTYLPVAGASSPHPANISGAQQFFIAQ